MGIINLYPSSAYLPCRLKLVELILNISENLDMNCSITKILTEMLKSKEFISRRIKPGRGDASVDFDIYLKVPNHSDAFGDIWMDLFKRLTGVCLKYFALSAEKVYATEFGIFWVKMLRVIRTNAKDFEIKQELKTLSRLLEENYYKVDKIRVSKSAVPQDYLAKRSFILEEFSDEIKLTKNQKKNLNRKKLKTDYVAPKTTSEECMLVTQFNKLRKEKERLVLMKIQAEQEDGTIIKKPKKGDDDDNFSADLEDMDDEMEEDDQNEYADEYLDGEEDSAEGLEEMDLGSEEEEGEEGEEGEEEMEEEDLGSEEEGEGGWVEMEEDSEE